MANTLTQVVSITGSNVCMGLLVSQKISEVGGGWAPHKKNRGGGPKFSPTAEPKPPSPLFYGIALID